MSSTTNAIPPRVDDTSGLNRANVGGGTRVAAAARIGILALLLAALAVPTLLHPSAADAAAVNPVARESYVKAGDWRTVASLWNASARGVFRGPAGAQIRVRYGAGWFAVNRQRQTLDGFTYKYLNVGGGSIFYARMQVKVPYDTWVYWTYIPT